MAKQTRSLKKRISPEVLRAREESDRLANERISLATIAVLKTVERENYACNTSQVHFNPKDPQTYPQMDPSLCNTPRGYGINGRRRY